MLKTRMLKVDIEPKVLKWFIEGSGWDESELRNKLDVSESKYNGWLNGNVKPTLKQLEAISNKIKRPLSAFFLAEPPEESPLPKDYRTVFHIEGKFDKKTIFAIRKARRLQHLSQELSNNVNENLKLGIKKHSIKSKSQEIAIYFREKVFELSEERQKKFNNDYEFYKFLRERMEELNLIPFQISMPIEDARGFTLVDEMPNVIVVNSKDEIRPRIFSLMHEFAHVILGESGVSLPDLTIITKDDIERWCNSFASEFLLPEAIAKSVFNEHKETLVDTSTLKKISNKFYVSKGMLLYKMSSLNYISKLKYNEVLQRPRTKIKKKSKGGGGVPSERKCISEVGKKFVSLVADNYDKGFITYADALNYLSVKSNKLNKVFSKATK